MSQKYRLYFFILLIIISNILNMLFPKGMGYEEQTGFVYQLSKYTYGLCIVIMLPSLFSTKLFYFEKMRWMTIMVIIYIIYAFVYSYQFDIASYLKTTMICISFIFFEEVLTKSNVDKRFIYAYMLSIFMNIIYLTFTQNRLGQAASDEGHISGGQGIAVSMVYLLPLVFYLFKGKFSSYLFIIGLIAVIISLRRTAILAYLLCIPFLYSRMKGNISRKFIFMIIVITVIVVIYILDNYGFVIHERFADMTEADNSGNYGSGRTGWWTILINNYISSPEHWIQGFGLGQVAQHMANAGFPYGYAHNDYLEIGYTYGLIGFYLWFGSIIDIILMYRNKSLKEYSSLIMMASISYLFISFASGATAAPHFMSISFFSALMLKENRISNKIKSYERLFVHYPSSQLS